MEYLHSKGVVHLDLALRNILLDKSLNAKITDFGVARAPPEGIAEQRQYEDLGYLYDCTLLPSELKRSEMSEKTDVAWFGRLVLQLLDKGTGFRLHAPTMLQFFTVSSPSSGFLARIQKLSERCLQADVLLRPSFACVADAITQRPLVQHAFVIRETFSFFSPVDPPDPVVLPRSESPLDLDLPMLLRMSAYDDHVLAGLELLCLHDLTRRDAISALISDPSIPARAKLALRDLLRQPLLPAASVLVAPDPRVVAIWSLCCWPAKDRPWGELSILTPSPCLLTFCDLPSDQTESSVSPVSVSSFARGLSRATRERQESSRLHACYQDGLQAQAIDTLHACKHAITHLLQLELSGRSTRQHQRSARLHANYQDGLQGRAGHKLRSMPAKLALTHLCCRPRP